MPSQPLARRVLRASTPGAVALVIAAALPAASASAHAPAASTAQAAPAAQAAPSATISCSQAYLPLPDPVCTPGATYSAVTQSTINSTICVSGWTTTVRPPTSYTNPLKVQQIAEYGYADTNTADYEEDHFIPLELGGDPRSPLNLWPQPHYGATGTTSSSKDSVENQLKTLVCSGKATLAAAQQAIATDWTTAIAVVTGQAGSGPSAPAGLTVTATTSSSVSLSWTASTDAGSSVTGYDVYNGGAPAVSVTGTTATVTGLTAGTSYTFTVKAKDAAGKVSAAGAPATATTTGGSSGCTAAQLLGNPGFESGTAAPWTTSASTVLSSDTTEPARTGSWDAWLDGYGSTNTDTLAQSVTVPAGCSASFAFWLHIDTAETSTSTAYDTLGVDVLSASGTVLAHLATYSNLDAGTGYARHAFDLSSYAGQKVTVRFTGTEDYQQQTSFVLDDTALTVN